MDKKSVHGNKPLYVFEQPMTYDDYAALPDDGFRYELVDQKLELMSPAPSTIHQLFVAALRDVLLHGPCGSNYMTILSPVDVVFSPHDVRQPDLVMIHRSRMEIVKTRGIFGVPDLVVEVLSPGSFQRDRKDKVDTYSRYGVTEYWLADPQNATLEQYLHDGSLLRLSTVYEAEEPVTSERLPCVNFTMGDIVRTLPKLEE